MLDKMIDMKEAAERLKVHPETLKRAARAGQLEAYEIGGKCQTTEEALEKYVQSKKIKVVK